jgi:hypothetical protein
LALQKAKELWASLSLPEPENQARPTNLEQLLVLFTRETTRRIVHLVNGTANLAARAPKRTARALLSVSHRLITIFEQVLKVTNESIYRLLADVLMAATSLIHHLKGAGMSYGALAPRNLATRPQRKFQFITNQQPTNLNRGAALGNGACIPNPKSLLLIAVINVPPLPAVATKRPFSIIEELRPKDYDDCEGGRRSEAWDVGHNKASDTMSLKPIINGAERHAVVYSIVDKTKNLTLEQPIVCNNQLAVSKVDENGEKEVPNFTQHERLSSIINQ